MIHCRTTSGVLLFPLKASLAILFLLPGLIHASAQQDTIPAILQQVTQEEVILHYLESLAEELHEEQDYAGLYEQLESLMLNPINLNDASAEDLRRLGLLNDLQINNLLVHISIFGKLLGIHELQSIEGFEPGTIQMILPFVMVCEDLHRRHFSLDDMVREGKHQYFLRFQQLLEEQHGYRHIDKDELAANPNAGYLGSPLKIYSRYRFTYYQNVSLGITAEKDPGEEFFKGTQVRGFDYYSAHLLLRDLGRVRALAIGDYQVQFGQGLTLWSGLAFGKGSDVVNIKKNGLGFRPYTSVDENNFMRGAATTIASGAIELSAFWSSKNRDANVLETDTISGEALIITSLQQTGLHRTPRELENRNAVNETIYGGNLTFRRRKFSMGITAYHMKLGAEYQRDLSFYNQFDFNGPRNTNFGMDYNYLLHNFNFFGEFARSENGGFALLNGLVVSLDKRLSLSLVHRYFSKDYQSLFASSFGENTRVVNEKGIFLGLSLRLSNAWNLSLYADHFAFPWMKYRTYMPSRGYDYMTQLSYRPSRQMEVYARFRVKNKPLNSRQQSSVIRLDDVIRHNFRIHFSYQISPSFLLRNRIEHTNHQFGQLGEKGYFIYQDVIYKPLSGPLAITFRYALFDTGGFNSRIYAFENDVLYAFSFPFFYNKGSRVYLLTHYRLNRSTDLYCRLAQTLYTSRESSGSGLDAIQGNTRTEIKVQIRLKF